MKGSRGDVILVVSSSSRERSALIALGESAGWVATGADSLREARRILRRQEVRVLVTRHTLADGYADHLARERATADRGRPSRLIVLAGPGLPAAEEARQVTLGADCVLRDPVRSEVLLAYLARHLRREEADRHPAARPATRLGFAGGDLSPDDRTLRLGKRVRTLTPREAGLAEALATRPGEVATYDTLYAEVLGRRFRGDTSNLRVLLGKLAASCAAIGGDLRAWVEVIPKSGYRLHARRRR
ncbi:MAG: response regulator transcription factor [Opitutaceae bacterium]